MADGNQNMNRARATALQEYRLRLTTTPVNGAPRAPTLGLNVRKNNPQIVVRTNVPNDPDYGKIAADLDTTTFFVVAELIKRVADGPNNKKEVVKSLARRFVNGKRSDPMPDTFIHVGKDESGLVWIAVQSWNKDRPLVRFPFAPPELQMLMHEDGNPWTPQELSVVYAHAWSKVMTEIAPHVIISEYTEPPPRDNNSGGGGGGNWNNNRGGGGGGNWNNNSGGGGGGGGNWNNNSGGGNSGGGGGWGGDNIPM